MNRSLKKLEQVIGYQFENRRLLEQAMTHSSYANEHRLDKGRCNERLEFLGDAVLELASSDFLFKNYREMPEGDLTKLRASLVCEPTLAFCAEGIGLGEFLLLGKGEEGTGGRLRHSVVSDGLEALIGAIYLDGGFANAKEFIDRFILNDIEHKKLFYDSKTILQEIVQRDYKDEEIRYVITGEEGPDHAKQFLVEVMIGKNAMGSGRGSTKKSAAQGAAYRAIIGLKGKTEDVSEKH